MELGHHYQEQAQCRERLSQGQAGREPQRAAGTGGGQHRCQLCNYSSEFRNLYLQHIKNKRHLERQAAAGLEEQEQEVSQELQEVRLAMEQGKQDGEEGVDMNPEPELTLEQNTRLFDQENLKLGTQQELELAKVKQERLLQTVAKEHQGLPVVPASSSHGIVVSLGRGALGLGGGRSMGAGEAREEGGAWVLMRRGRRRGWGGCQEGRVCADSDV